MSVVLAPISVVRGIAPVGRHDPGRRGVGRDANASNGRRRFQKAAGFALAICAAVGLGTPGTAAGTRASGAWVQLTPSGALPEARSDHAAAWDSDRQRLIVFGGWGAGGGF